MKLLQLATLAMIPLLAAGCITTKQYEGPVKPRNEIAILENPEGAFGGMLIKEINNKRPGFGAAEGFEFLPGVVTLVVEHVSQDEEKGDPITLQFIAEAGKVYSLEHDDPAVLNRLPRWNAWVEHKRSNQVVSTVTNRAPLKSDSSSEQAGPQQP